MDVTKIDIQKIRLDIEKNTQYVPFIITKGFEDKTLSISEEPKESSVEVTKTLYKVIKVEERDCFKYYLVQVDDLNLFNVLLEVNRNDIENHIKEQIEIVEKRHKSEIETVKIHTKVHTKEEIKQLPWYKRLFKKF